MDAKIELMNGIQTKKLDDGTFLYFWYANNKNRGSNNCTIIRSSSPNRAPMSAKQTEIIASTRTSSWRGNVNFSKHVQAALGL